VSRGRTVAGALERTALNLHALRLDGPSNPPASDRWLVLWSDPGFMKWELTLPRGSSAISFLGEAVPLEVREGRAVLRLEGGPVYVKLP
jgi:hypothetical protein